MEQCSEKFNKAFEVHKSGDLSGACDLYMEILKTEPNNAEVWDLLGVVHFQQNNFLEAETCIKKAISLEPRVYYLENLAKLYLEKGDFTTSIALYEDILKLHNTYENLFNLAMAYKNAHFWNKAKRAYEKALELNPNGYESYYNLAYLAFNDNDPHKAIECYKKVLEIKPNDWETTYFLGLAYMQVKDYKNGLKAFESRFCKKSAILSQEKLYPELMKEKPEWKGESLKDKVLFTYYEAGFGDLLMFYRYVPILTSMCKKLIIKPQRELLPLFRENSYGAEIIENYDYKKQMYFDYHLPFLSIPNVLQLEGESVFVSHDCGYLKANAEKVRCYKEKYCSNDKFKIGIKWQGNTHYDLERVLQVEDFFTLFEIPNTQFYSFQTFEGSEEIDKIKEKYDIVNLGETFSDFSDTAGAIENMDLIISNDSSLIHLAGAMNKTSFVLLPYVYNWRWHTDLSKCDWYDCVTVFRQKEFGKWKSIFEDVKAKLIEIKDKK